FCGPCERDPGRFLQDVLAHGRWGTPIGPGPWAGQAFKKRLARAGAVRGQARVETYTRLDDELARYAPFAVYGAFQYSEYFGARVGCKRFPPFTQGVDLGALCIRS